MATRPSTDPVWATNVSALITTPPGAKQDIGWELTSPKEKPFLDYFNWWMNLVYQWILYLRTIFGTSYGVTILDGQTNTALASLTIDPAVYRMIKLEVALYVDAATDVYAVIQFYAVSNGTTWAATGYGQWAPMSSTAIPGLTINITTAGVLQYSTISYAGFLSAKASIKITQLDLA